MRLSRFEESPRAVHSKWFLVVLFALVIPTEVVLYNPSLAFSTATSISLCLRQILSTVADIGGPEQTASTDIFLAT